MEADRQDNEWAGEDKVVAAHSRHAAHKMEELEVGVDKGVAAALDNSHCKLGEDTHIPCWVVGTSLLSASDQPPSQGRSGWLGKVAQRWNPNWPRGLSTATASEAQALLR